MPRPSEESARILAERGQSYGPATASFPRIAALWSALLDHPVSAYQVALLMAALKLLRAEVDPPHKDSLVDLVGYADLAYELTQE